MPVEVSWPVFLPEKLQQQGQDITIINASISGDTSGNGLDRLPDLLKQYEPQWILVELGANDGLRGFHPKIITKNLQQIISLSQQFGTKVALMQIKIPPNYGQRYSQAFEDIYPNLAEQFQIPLLPFFLEQIILKDDWMKQDGLHPKEVAQPWISNYVADSLALYLD